MRQLRSSVVFCGGNIGPAASGASSKGTGNVWVFTIVVRVNRLSSENEKSEARKTTKDCYVVNAAR